MLLQGENDSLQNPLFNMTIFGTVLSSLEECVIWTHLFLKNGSIYKSGKHKKKTERDEQQIFLIANYQQNYKNFEISKAY